MERPDWRDSLEHARHNLAFLAELTPILNRHPEFGDWAIVVVAYSALHFTKAAILRDHNKGSERHIGYMGVNGWVDGHDDLVRRHLGRPVSKDYRELYDRGQEARYRGYYRKQRGNAATLEVARLRILLDRIQTACGF